MPLPVRKFPKRRGQKLAQARGWVRWPPSLKCRVCPAVKRTSVTGCPGQGAASGPSLGGSCSAWAQPSSGPWCEELPPAQSRAREVLSTQHAWRHHGELAVPRAHAPSDLERSANGLGCSPPGPGPRERGRLPPTLTQLCQQACHSYQRRPSTSDPRGRDHLLDRGLGESRPHRGSSQSATSMPPAKRK